MATKAEQFKTEQQRNAKPNKPKQPKHKPRFVEQAEVSGTARRNLTLDKRNAGGPALEDSATGKPSRKSTRGSAGHVKLSTNLTSRQKRKVSSPSERAARARVR
jgi:hypothetical protein